jgi:hypothetical protein
MERLEGGHFDAQIAERGLTALRGFIRSLRERRAKHAEHDHQAVGRENAL